MALNAALPGQPYPLVDENRCLTAPWYNALIRLVRDASNHAIETFSTLIGGTLYANGSYTNVPLTGGSGSGATANITVSGGSVTGVVIVNPGINYQAGNVLSANVASIGGTGSGFSIAIAAVRALKMDFPPISYPFVDVDRTVSDGWYNSMLGLGVAAATIGGLKAAVPGQPYPIVNENRLITLPWYNALVVIANDLL
jgi:hypothetical protein